MGTALQKTLADNQFVLFTLCTQITEECQASFWLSAVELLRCLPAVELLSLLLHVFFSPHCPNCLTRATRSSECAPSKWHGTDDFCSAANWKGCRSLGDKSTAGVAFQPSSRRLALLLYSSDQEEHDPSPQSPHLRTRCTSSHFKCGTFGLERKQKDI